MGCVEVLCVITALFCSDLGMDDEGDDDPVPLPNVNAAILKKVRLVNCYRASIQVLRQSRETNRDMREQLLFKPSKVN